MVQKLYRKVKICWASLCHSNNLLFLSVWFPLTVWNSRQSWMHPESAAKVFCSGAHRGPTALLSLFFYYFFLLSRGISGPHKTMGHDRARGRSPAGRSQEKSRRSNTQQKSSGLPALASELCVSSAHFLHLSDASLLHTAGGAFGIRERGW